MTDPGFHFRLHACGNTRRRRIIVEPTAHWCAPIFFLSVIGVTLVGFLIAFGLPSAYLLRTAHVEGFDFGNQNRRTEFYTDDDDFDEDDSDDEDDFDDEDDEDDRYERERRERTENSGDNEDPMTEIYFCRAREVPLDLLFAVNDTDRSNDLDSETDSCRLYLAPSTIPGAGLGTFTGRHLTSGDLLEGTGDVAYPIYDFDYHHYRKRINDTMNPTADYVWHGPQLGMFVETNNYHDYLTGFAPGL
jgi:hypothetical protein